ncbi:MAG TPA: MATE family efflux transporter [Allosphingosinicella sp.]|jgi:MATE family multidrug resistance protein
MSGAAIDRSRPWRSEARATLALAWPLILTNVAQALIHATDVVLLGWAGPRTLAAATLGINVYFAFLVFGLGLMIASSPILARELGARRHSVRELRRTVRQSMWAAAAICVPVWIILWNTGALLVLLGQDPALATDAQLFVRYLMWGMFPFLLYLVLRSFISALERPFWSFGVGLIAVLFNAVLNYALIFGKLGFPELGIIGAGIGSSCANLLMFVGLATVVTLDRRFRRYRLFGRFWRPDWERFREVWRLGLPIAITLGLEITIFNAAVFLMGLIGTESLAAHAIAIQIASLTFMVPLGLGQAVTVRVGLAHGRRDREGVAIAGWTALGITILFMGMTGLAMIAAPTFLVSAFLDSGDPANAQVIRLAVSFLVVAALFQIFDGAQAVGAGMLRGLHDTRVPMLYAAFGYWIVGILTGIGLGFGLGWDGVGIWTGLAAGLGVVAVLMIARWTRRERLGLLG